MKLPIDVIPGGGQLRFRWQHRTDTIVGQKVVECDGPLPPSVEQAVAELIATAKRLAEERDKLQAFKDWTHAYLDAHDVPAAPPGVHGAAGCRIGDRIDWLMEQLNELRGHAQRANGAEAGDGVDMGAEPKSPKGSSSRGRRGL